MKIEIRADGSLHIEGYVNAVERDSRTVICPECGKCVEQIRAGAFGEALRAAKNVDILLNHDKGRKLGSTSGGTLSLYEDNIGLRASTDITDEEVISEARAGKLRGWSFGFKKLASEIENRADNIPRRIVTALSLSEVSLIDDRFTPCYAGTSIELRANEETGEADEIELRFDDSEVELTDNSATAYLNDWVDGYLKLIEAEERYNPYHDPTNGRFTSGTGGGKYIMMVPEGKAGYGILMKDVGIDDSELAKTYYHAAYSNSNINNGKHRLANGGNNYNSNTSSGGEGVKFGVAGGIGTAYTIVKVDGQNVLIRNDYLMETKDGGLIISNKSLAIPRKGKTSGIDYAKSPHSAEPETISGISKGKPMTFEEADNGNANPKYSSLSYGYTHNCQSCVVTHEARMRGYDLETRPKGSAVSKELSYDTTLAWIDPKTGKKPSLTAINGNKGKELENVIKENERYSVQYSHGNSRSGHIITATRNEEGKIMLYDPQTNIKLVGRSEINDYFTKRNARNVRYLRVDNLDFNEDVVNAVTKPRKRRK